MHSPSTQHSVYVPITHSHTPPVMSRHTGHKSKIDTQARWQRVNLISIATISAETPVPKMPRYVCTVIASKNPIPTPYDGYCCSTSETGESCAQVKTNCGVKTNPSSRMNGHRAHKGNHNAKILIIQRVHTESQRKHNREPPN
jgi:hypothetical protein